jgi:anti-sigma regulatory factor (Ser/Thr protein kinase)
MRDEAFLPVAAAAFVFLALSLNLAFINSIMINYFNAIRRVFIANILVVSRLVLFMVLPAYLLFSSMGIYAVWISLIAAEALTLSLVLPLLRIVRRRQSQLSKYLLLDNTLIQNSKVIDFSVKSTVTDITSAAAKISGFCEENEVSPKKIMRISLAIEEMLLLINEFSFSPDRTQYTDVRIMVTPESIVLRIRNSGAYFNPVRYYYENKDTEAGAQRTLGMVMILKMAVSVEFRETFGMNNLIITI